MTALEDLRKKSLRGRVVPFSLALVYLGLGDHPPAIGCLEQAHATDSQWPGWLKLDHVFDPLHSKPRFVALLCKLGFSSDMRDRAHRTVDELSKAAVWWTDA